MASHRGTWTATALLVLGFGCYVSFLIGLMSLPVLFAEGGLPRSHEGFTALLAGVLVVALGLIFRSLKEKYRKAFLGRTGFAVLAANICLLAFAQCWSLLSQQATLPPVFLTAFQYALLSLQLAVLWAHVCKEFPLPTLRFAIPAAMLFSVLVGVGTHYLSLWLDMPEGFFSLLSPLVSSLALGALIGHMRESESAAYEKHSSLARATRNGGLLAIGILSFYILSSGVFYSVYTYGMQNYSLQGASHKIIVLIFAAFLLAAPWIASRKNTNSAVIQTFMCFVPFCLIALYCAVAFESSLPGIARGIILPTRACALFLILVIIVELAFEEGYSLPDLTVFVCLPLVFFSRAVMFDAWAIWIEIEKGFPSNALMASFVLVSVLVMVLSTFWLLYARGRDSAATNSLAQEKSDKGAAASNDAEADSTKDASAHDDLISLQEQHGLSLREAQVITYISQGYTKKKIAEVLFLSVNSVSTYTKSAYAKLGVHNRQEVIDLMHERSERTF